MRRDAHALSFPEIQIGDTFSVERTFEPKDVDLFAELSGDFSPLHVDESYAANTEFGARVVHGSLVASLFSELIGMRIPGEPALYLSQESAFRRPVLVGEKVSASATVTDKNAPTMTIQLRTEVRDAEGRVAVSGSARVKVRGPAPPSEPKPDAAVEARTRSDHPVALVTGGSRGIGAEIARELGRRGIRVGIVYLNSGDAARLVAGEIQAAGSDAVALQGDVREPDAVTEILQAVASRWGRLDYLVNAAVGELHQRPTEDLAWDDFLRHLQTQLRAPFELCRAALPMLRVQGGSVVNVLTQAVHGAPPSQMADYVAAKHALLGLSRSLAAEWAKYNIRVNTVSPGLTQTDLTQHYNERIFKMEAARTPLKRIAVPSDVARAVAFLLGDDAGFITGVDLPITGGQTLS